MTVATLPFISALIAGPWSCVPPEHLTSHMIMFPCFIWDQVDISLAYSLPCSKVQIHRNTLDQGCMWTIPIVFSLTTGYLYNSTLRVQTCMSLLTQITRFDWGLF